MAGLTLAPDMPRKSFLLVPLEATDFVVEDGDEVRQGMQYSGVSPTPRKSLFEMDAKDLRAAEQAWLEKVGSSRVPKPHVGLCTRHLSEELSIQQQESTLPGTGAPADGANVTAAIPCVSSSELRQPQAYAMKASEQGISGIEGIAYAELDDAAALPVSEATVPLQLLADEQNSSISSHDSLTLRQRFSLVQATHVPDSASPSALPDLSSVQDLASPQEDAPPAGCGDSAQDAVGLDKVRGACGHEVMSSVQDAGTSDAEPSEVASDPCQEPSIAAGTFHMPRTPWMNLKAVRRPSASWRRVPQLSVQEPWDETSIASRAPAALPHQAQGLSSRPTSGHTPVHWTEQTAKQQQDRKPPSSEGEEAASAAASGLLHSSAEKEHGSAHSDIDTEKTDGMYDEPGWKPRLSEQQMGTQSSAGGTLPSKSGRLLAPDARLSSSPTITTSLESAAPSAMDRLMHSQGRLEASHDQADGSRAGERPAVTREQRARPLLRGRTPEECGVKMYERALAAEQRRQARANTLRRELDVAADAACTFSPRLNTEKTNRMLWKSLSVPLASATSQSRTAVQQYSPVADSAGSGVAHQPPASTEPGSHVRSSHHRSMSGIAAGQRLYTSGLAGLERQRTTASLHNQRELESLRAASPRARSLPRAIYGAAALARIDLIRSHAISPHRRKPAYEDTVKECTFQPVTTWRSLSRTAMSGTQTAKAGLDLTTVSSEAALSRFLHRASLKPSDAEAALGADGNSAAPASMTSASILEQHSASGLGGQAVKQKQGTDQSFSWASAVKSKQLDSEQMGRGAKFGQLDRKPGQHGQAGSSPARTATWKLSEQLDFVEFLYRQQSHIQMHNHQMERTRLQISEEMQRGLGISPGSRALLKHWTSVPVHKKVLHSQRSAPGQLKSTPLAHSWTADTALRPRITAKARLRRAHTIAELHDGGTSRREHALEQLRAEKVLAEEKLLTFRPSINHYYHTSRPQLRLSNPGPYIAHVQAKALKRRESLLRMRAAAEELELKECTHSPRTTKLPAFIQRLARDFSADPDKHPEHADGLISPRSEDEGLGHLFTILQPEWR